MARVATFTTSFLGCKVSQADMMQAREALLDAGHVEADPELAEVALVTTCCITSEAEAKSRQSVRRSLRSARTVFVSGCAANLNAAQFADLDARVRPLVGSADDVATMLGGALGACADLGRDVLARERGSGAASRTRGFVKVQDGCDGDCAYCIIPRVRGDARSRPSSAVLREVRRRVAAGQPEMVLTGISVGDYRDPERGLELGELMLEVAHLPGVERVRLSSVEVIHVKDSLRRALASEPRICPHLHIPLQSGDDGVLAAMARHYSAGEYVRTVAALRAEVPHVNVTTDVIVGFPTETEEAFERTLAILDDAAITRVHTFAYSPRPGTAAAALGDRVASTDKKRRSLAMRGRSELRSRHHRAAKLGRVETVLIDKLAGDACSGYSADYTRCYLPAGAGVRGELVAVRCEELYADGIRCVTTC